MSLRNAMNAAVSGMNAETRALGVVGDNVANMNTIGFKQSRAIFENVLGEAVGSRNSIGAGSIMSRTQQIFAQGTTLSTGQPTDLAISGDGFFIVNGNVDGVNGNFFTRAGQFTVRNDGVLVTPGGQAVQGFRTRADGTFEGTLSSLQVPTQSLPPQATTEVNVLANLDARAAVPTTPFSLTDPSNTSNFSVPVTVYDSLGNARAMTAYFRKSADNAWTYNVVTDGGNIAGGTAGTNVSVVSGTLAFNTSGALQTTAVTAGGTADFAGAAPGQRVAINFGTPVSAGGSGVDGITQFSSQSNVNAVTQDGYASAELSGVRIDGNGVLNGVFTNGQTRAVGQVAVARFRSNDGLGRAGQNLWIATRDSGDAAMGVAGSGGRGAIVSGALEQSNVDVTAQFVELISHQRGFQANSKTITVADQMQETIQQLVR